MSIYGKNLKKIFSPEPVDQWPWNQVCSIVYVSTTKVVQIMTLGWPWPILRQGQIWSHRLLYGKKWKLLFFGNYCSLAFQSCLKHLAKWVTDEYQSVTQISKLKLVFLINSWAIWNQNSYESLRENRNENLYKWVGSHDHTCQVSRKSKSETALGPRIFAYNLVIERTEKSGAQVLKVRFFALINRHKLLTERDKQYCFVLLISFTITESIIYL